MNILVYFFSILCWFGLFGLVEGFTNRLLLHAKIKNPHLSSESVVSDRSDTRLQYKSQNAPETEITIWKEIVKQVSDALPHICVPTRSGKNSSVLFDEARDTARRYELHLIAPSMDNVDHVLNGLRSKFPEISVLNAQVIVQKSLNNETSVIRCFTHLERAKDSAKFLFQSSDPPIQTAIYDVDEKREIYRIEEGDVE